MPPPRTSARAGLDDERDIGQPWSRLAASSLTYRGNAVEHRWAGESESGGAYAEREGARADQSNDEKRGGAPTATNRGSNGGDHPAGEAAERDAAAH